MERPYNCDDTTQEEKDEYHFVYRSAVFDRNIELRFGKDACVTNMEVIEEFCNFLSAVYGYRVELRIV